MLRSVKSLGGLAIGATDGPIGKIHDFYFDDESWVIRYLIVSTNAWLGGREVLISPYLLGRPTFSGDTLPVTVSKEQVRNSPGIDTDKPISRQYERSYLGYYGYPLYWGGTGLWGEASYPGTLLPGVAQGGYRGFLRAPRERDAHGDPHLRSCASVAGYHIRATDGGLGHVQGFLLDDITWSIRYLIVNTSNWWVGHHVLVSPEWILDISWSDSSIAIDLERQTIKDAPLYEGDRLVDRDAEIVMYEHYRRPGYWHGAPAPRSPADAP